MKNKTVDGKKTGRKKLSWWMITIIVVLGIALVGTVTAVIFVNSRLDLVNRFNDDDNSQTKKEDDDFEQDDDGKHYPILDPEDIRLDVTDDEFNSSDKVTNILLIGQDKRPDEKTRQRSDSMVLFSINETDGRITLISFMRDTYVSIPGHYDNRLNTAYRFGGIELLDATLKKNFGVKVDCHALVDFESFVGVVDAADGVDVYMTSKETNYLSVYKWGLKADSVNHLNGQQALAYARIRHLAGGDRMRTQRQRNVLEALIKKFRTLEIGKLNAAINKLLPLVTTDMNNAQILQYAISTIRIGTSDMPSYSIPVEGTYKAASVRGMAVYVPDLKKNREYLRGYIYGD